MEDDRFHFSTQHFFTLHLRVQWSSRSKGKNRPLRIGRRLSHPMCSATIKRPMTLWSLCKFGNRFGGKRF